LSWRGGDPFRSHANDKRNWLPFHRGNTIHDTNDEHRRAAEQHELAARAHRTAAEHNEKGDHETENWHAQRALEYSDHAYKLAMEGHSKSGRIVSI